MFFGLALMVMGLAVMAFPVLAQADCSFYSDNYLCYTGQIGCDDTDGASVSSAGQSGEIGQLACNRDGYLDARDTESLVVYLFNDGTQRRLTVTTFEVFDPSWSPLFIKSLDDLP